jgi:hypothetical protein
MDTTDGADQTARGRPESTSAARYHVNCRTSRGVVEPNPAECTLVGSTMIYADRAVTVPNSETVPDRSVVRSSRSRVPTTRPTTVAVLTIGSYIDLVHSGPNVKGNKASNQAIDPKAHRPFVVPRFTSQFATSRACCTCRKARWPLPNSSPEHRAEARIHASRT